MSWTDERIDRLKALWTQGMTARQIADELGGVSRNAVIGTAHRLGLQSRPSPVKPNEHEGESPEPAPKARQKPAVEPRPQAPAAAAPAEPGPEPERPVAQPAAPAAAAASRPA